jgi:hypothetical protein
VTTNPGPSEGELPKDEQSETVGAPSGDDSPPRRTKSPQVLIVVGLVAVLVLVVALVVAAVRAA